MFGRNARWSSKVFVNNVRQNEKIAGQTFPTFTKKMSSSVVGAASAYGEEALKVATTVFI